MRSPHRIQPMVVELTKFWFTNSDLRLAQIVCIAASSVGLGRDPFYMEDAALMKWLKDENRKCT